MGFQHAARWPEPTSAKPGFSSRHRSTGMSQRDANGHPGFRSARLGGSPEIEARVSYCLRSVDGSDLRSK